jgi:hypothetical protein
MVRVMKMMMVVCVSCTYNANTPAHLLLPPLLAQCIDCFAHTLQFIIMARLLLRRR